MSAIFEGMSPERPQKWRNVKKTTPKLVLPLDTFSKRPRGRPRKVSPSEIRGRAYNYRRMLDQVWDRLWSLLAQAQTEEDVIRAFDEGASPYTRGIHTSAGQTHP